MRDVLTDLERLAAGGPVGRAVVTTVWGSAPRQPGACFLATADGRLAGSVSGGCVESAVALEIAEALTRGTSRLVKYGVPDARAWEVGLACGGTLEVLVEPAVRPELRHAAAAPQPSTVATVIAGDDPIGAAMVLPEEGSAGPALDPPGLAAGSPQASRLAALAEPLTAAAREALRLHRSRTVQLTDAAGEITVLLEVFPRPPRLVIFGGVPVAAALTKLARPLGYQTIIADGRPAFLTAERFPEADQLLLAWPDEAFARIGLDSGTFVCVLSHDPKFDDPALLAALRSPAAYVGAIGSRKTQQARRERLAEQGLTPEQLARLRGPIGLDLGGREPAETALAILAEMTAVRYGGSGGVLAERSRRPAG